MNPRIRTVLIILLVLRAGPALAQGAAPVALSPDDPARWDVSGEVGWLSSNKSDIAPDWDDWYDVASGGASLGYYWSPNLRSEVRLAFGAEAGVYEEQRIAAPGQPYPIFRVREHHYRTATLAGGLSYQFFDNRWFHPSLGGGLELVRESERVFAPEQLMPSREPRVPIVLPAVNHGTTVSWAARPFVTAGFKWYGNERAFARSDVRVSFGGGGVAHVVWTAGIGVDL
jgi:hypothetical protein